MYRSKLAQDHGQKASGGSTVSMQICHTSFCYHQGNICIHFYDYGRVSGQMKPKTASNKATFHYFKSKDGGNDVHSCTFLTEMASFFGYWWLCIYLDHQERRRKNPECEKYPLSKPGILLRSTENKSPQMLYKLEIRCSTTSLFPPSSSPFTSNY